jgi:hypothetical protein
MASALKLTIDVKVVNNGGKRSVVLCSPITRMREEHAKKFGGQP